jgi:acetoin utilization protein AcuB
MLDRRIERWMSRDPFTLATNARVVDALELMERERIRHVPVVDGRGRLAGIVSDRDVKRALPPPESGPEASARFARKPVSAIMTRRVFRLDPDATIREAAELICQEKISALPVCDGERLIGIVTTDDLLWAYVEIERGEEEDVEESEIDAGLERDILRRRGRRRAA